MVTCDSPRNRAGPETARELTPWAKMLQPNHGPDESPALTRSGIGPLDEHLGGGLASGRIHLLTGGIGTGKSLACMQFLGAGLEAGERVALLTSARPSDVRAQAAYAGIAIDGALREGRLVALRFRPTFGSRIAHAASPRAALDDLERMLGANTPSRIAIDPVVPFLGDGSPLGEALTSLAECLDRWGATALLTYPGDISDGADRRFDGLVERAATVMRLERRDDGIVRCAVLRSRTFGREPGPCLLRIVPRSGIVGPLSRKPALATGSSGARPGSRRLVLMHATDVAAPEIVELLRQDYQLAVSALDESALTSRDLGDAAAVAIETQHSSLDAIHDFLRRAAAREIAAPIAIVVRFNLRSIDRARLLRAGADDVLATDMSPAEFLERVRRVLARGPRTDVRSSVRVPSRTELDARGEGALDRQAFAANVRQRTTLDHPVHYTVATLAPPRAARGTDDEPAALADLTALVMHTARVGSGDLVGCFDGRLAVYLHGARRGDASPFIERVRNAWPARERGSIEIDFLSYPSDEPRLRTLIGAPLQS